LVWVPSACRAFRRRRASIEDESRRDPRSRLDSPRLRSGRSCVLRVMVFGPSRPSVGSARQEEGYNPRAFNQVGTRPPGRWGYACRSRAPAPQSKPVTRASRLVAQIAPSVAFGLGPRILAAGPAPIRLYSDRGRLCEPDAKACSSSLEQIRSSARPASRECCSPTASSSRAALRRDRCSGCGRRVNTGPPAPVEK
jgi:hypothetical protein